MKLNKLTISNFRNLSKQVIQFEDLNIISGPNASGKSSILEAINLLSTTKSIRAEHDKEMVKSGHDIARLEAEITRDEEKQKLELMIVSDAKFPNLARKKVKINGVVKALYNFAGTLNSVIFTPTDLEIVTSSPQIRRRYLDSIFLQTSSEYRKAHTNLIKVVRQRNKLLEKIFEEHKGLSELEFWNDELIKASEIIHKHRSEFFEFTKERLSHYGKLLNSEHSKLVADYKISKVTKERLEEYKDREIGARSTLIGPNRDDFTIGLNNFDLPTYGSRGQQRMAILSLKLCEIDYISGKVHARPILLLDDIFSELDEEHRRHVFDIVNLQQTIISTTDLPYIKEHLSKFSLLQL